MSAPDGSRPVTGEAGAPSARSRPEPGATDPVAPLGRLVRHEAGRLLSESRIAPDPGRLADGWERRFIAEGARCEEAMALYRELGFEVVADPLPPEALAGECEDCQLVMALRFRTIYTRSPRGRR